MLCVLAFADPATIGMWCLSIAVDLGMSIILYRVASSTRQLERAEDERKSEVTTLNDKLHETATKLIDERFRAMTHEIKQDVTSFALTLQEMKSKLVDGEKTFDSLQQRDESIQLAVGLKLESMKDFFRDSCATSEDVRRHQDSVSCRFDRLEQSINKLSVSVGVLADRSEKHPGRVNDR